ncbi:UDP-3-O-(3-hydroxymyristoyl)glucosamine N-acyltransferase [Propionispora hippei]|uniref:UDP-3-O-acylglucosamine N-acyltransferase n=1 Tax=Propionispora hippei DSM 15287 TaxID=1123003 RepID=A0A1M6ENJ2_9FIRM|nr:UDP-3-O-(3-hydroxymyristoyl)glucosamine N-acyltransferase [Propionispora hippei]SHI87014.1 UDP-3-O-[3-hydroxymyristoyl] glucosamine N-acyltransferase [Propionispora hippei DSM 15287]
MELREIAELVGGSVVGDETVEIRGVTNIEEAGSGDITFAVPPHLEKAAASQAAAVIIPSDISQFAKPAVRVDNPRMAFAKLLEHFTPPVAVERGVHPSAVIGNRVVLGQNVAIMAHVVLADDVVIGDNTVIYPHSYIGAGVVIGSDTLIYSNVSIREGCQIGSRVILQNGAVIGSDGFGFVTIQGRHHKVPQVGNVIIGDDVEVGANTAIDRATTSSTVVNRGTKIDNLVHLGHNVVIGENCFVVALTGISGSTKVGNQVTFAGQVGSTGHITIGDNCVFAARAGIIGDVAPNSFFAGFPARPHKEWLRAEAYINKLPDLVKKVKELEKRVTELSPEG